jgi:BirA family biotin operon repressor/biotin-[acetyl-CoA-carboxylase] ligase
MKTIVTTQLSPRAWQLLVLLGDGEFHSGEQLARQCQLSRATVFNIVGEIETCGVAIQRIRGRGYRLVQSWQALDEAKVRLTLREFAARLQLEILPQASSSNTLLWQRAAQGAPSGTALAVELQTSGRGRMGRVWHSGLGNALTFSLLWRFDCGLNALSGLSLAVGLAIVRALQKFAARGICLKWPNDVLSPHGKLGGVLVEAQGDMLGPCAVVIGIGLNCSLPLHLEQRVDQAASALDQVCDSLPERNLLLAVLLQELLVILDEFAQNGFINLRADWESCHGRQNLPVRLTLPDTTVVEGIARGVSERGELLLETEQGVRQYNSGELET